jgi:hypothetical protein
MGEGWGVYCVLCFVDYICRKSFDYVCCKINRSNHVSGKLVKKLGFVAACEIDMNLDVVNISSDDRDVYLLRESEFPNDYSESLLNKISYQVS